MSTVEEVVGAAHCGADYATRRPLTRSLLQTGAALAAAAVLSACPPLDNPFHPYPEPDLDTYVVIIQPMAAISCSELGCHGTLQRQLSLYSIDALRAEPTPLTPIDPDHLSDAELQWNYDALRMRLIDETDADEATLLLKNLDPAVGGIEHADGTIVWETRDDPDYIALRDWIEGGL